MALALILLWFPDGRPPSRRWAPVGWLLVGATTLLCLGNLLTLGPTEANYSAGILNPLGAPSISNLATVLARVGGLGLLVGTIASVASLVLRFHRSRGDERQQLRWLAAVGGWVLAFFFFSAMAEIVHAPTWLGNIVWIAFILGVAIGILGAVTIAILKYHLYDIDIVLSKTIVYGLLAAFIGGVYVAIVVGVSALIPVGADSPLVSIAATGVVALTFQPARDRVQRFANRIVYGQRSTPYEVLSSFASNMASTYAR